MKLMFLNILNFYNAIREVGIAQAMQIWEEQVLWMLQKLENE